MDQIMETNTNQIVPPSQNPPMTNLPSNVPIGAKIIAALHYIVSIILIFAGIMLTFTSLFISFSGFGGLFSVLGYFGLSLGVVDGLLAIVWGGLHFTTGRGLWMGKEWGQVLAITISGLYLAGGIIELVMFGGVNYTTYIFFAIHIAIIAYLLFSKQIHAAFPSSGSKVGIILAVVAIAVYVPIAVKSYQSKTQAKKFVQNLQDEIKRTDQAVQQSNMDCKFYEYKNYDEKNIPLNTETGAGIYSNSTYKFQINIPQSYTMKEVRGVDYCQDTFTFYQPEDTTLGILLSVSVQPAKGDLNYQFDHEYKYEKNPQKFDTQIAGQQGMRITAGPYGNVNRIWYIFISDGKLFTISNWKNLTDDQFTATAASFQFTTENSASQLNNPANNPAAVPPPTPSNTQATQQQISSKGLDFSVKDLKITPANLNKNQTGTITFAIRNNGDTAFDLFGKSGYSIDYGDSHPSASNIINSTCVTGVMQPGAECQVSLSVSYDTSGTKTFAIIVDSAGVVSESNENNNRQQITFQVY